MNCLRLVQTLSILSLIHRTNANDRDETIDSDFGRSRLSELATEYIQDVGNEQKIAWRIKSGAEEIEHGDSETCSTSTTSKPLCKICAAAIDISFSPNGKLRLQEATFMQGNLIFPGTNFPQKLIDILMCTYSPIIGVGRFYLTRGGRAKSAYFINNVGVQKDEHRFSLYGRNFTWN